MMSCGWWYEVESGMELVLDWCKRTSCRMLASRVLIAAASQEVWQCKARLMSVLLQHIDMNPCEPPGLAGATPNRMRMMPPVYAHAW